MEFPKNYKPLRDFCSFTKIPDTSKITRFKQDFLNDLQLVFDNLVNLMEPVCQAIDFVKADMTIFDSSGIEAFVTENNPKYANRISISEKIFMHILAPYVKLKIGITHTKSEPPECYPHFIKRILFCTISSLFYLEITKRLHEFCNHLYKVNMVWLLTCWFWNLMFLIDIP